MGNWIDRQIIIRPRGEKTIEDAASLSATFAKFVKESNLQDDDQTPGYYQDENGRGFLFSEAIAGLRGTIQGMEFQEYLYNFSKINPSYAIESRWYDSNNGEEGFQIVMAGEVVAGANWDLVFSKDDGFPFATLFGLYPNSSE